MSLFISFVLLIMGLFLLWKAGDWSVTNAIRFSILYQIESFAIGFFIFAVATGLPEITSAIVSSIKKVPELSAGDLIGSTFVNLSLQLGIASIIAKHLSVEDHLRNRLFQTILIVSAIMLALLFIPRGNIYLGISLVAVYLLSFLRFPKEPPEIFEEVKKEIAGKKGFFPPKIEILFQLTGSLILLIFSAWLTVLSAVSIAKLAKVPLSLIGGTLIAVGTSLPELTLEIHAVKRKEFALALGDIFGSSLLNISMVLGMLILFNSNLSLSIARIVFPFFVPVVLWILVRLVQKRPFTLYDGIGLTLIFVFYLLRVSAIQFLKTNYTEVNLKTNF